MDDVQINEKRTELVPVRKHFHAEIFKNCGAFIEQGILNKPRNLRLWSKNNNALKSQLRSEQVFLWLLENSRLMELNLLCKTVYV